MKSSPAFIILPPGNLFIKGSGSYLLMDVGTRIKLEVSGGYVNGYSGEWDSGRWGWGKFVNGIFYGWR